MNIKNYPTPYQPLNKRNTVSFGKSQINILATSDNHGRIFTLPKYYQLIGQHLKDLFPNQINTDNSTPAKSIKNVAIFNGDWFMNPAPKGYLSSKNLSNGDIQFKLLKSFIHLIKSADEKCKIIFNIGNHDLDGGSKQLFNYLRKISAKTILTNTDISSSDLFKNLRISKETQQQKFLPEFTMEVQDDKNPNLINKVLFLSITTPGMEYYIPEGIKDLNLADRKQTQRKDYPKTIAMVNERVNQFKINNPNGSVVLISHTGIEVAETISKNIDTPPDLIINGHDHKDKVQDLKIKGKTIKAVSLYQNNVKVDSIKMHFNDHGKLQNITTQKFFSDEIKEETPANIITTKMNKLMTDDIKPYLYIESDKDLVIEGARFQNNHLANFINDGILSAINETPEGENTQLFCIPSTGFRKDLPKNDWVTNADVLNLLNGNVENIAKVYTGTASGKDIISMVLENMILHKKDEVRNTIVQWAGLKFNKAELIKISNELGLEKQSECVNAKREEYIKRALKANTILVQNKNGDYKPINPKENYKIAMPNYFFIKDRVPTAKKLGTCDNTTFKPLNKTMIQLFKDYLASDSTEKDGNKVIVKIKPDKRIIT